MYPTQKTTTTTPEITGGAVDVDTSTGTVTLDPQPKSTTPITSSTLPPLPPLGDNITGGVTENLNQTLTETLTPQTHTVKKDDTLYKLSETYGISLDELIRLNPKIDPTNIQIGAKIILK